MRPSNHSSLADGISDAKLQGSEASSPQNLQILTRYCAENRFIINRLAVVHGRLSTLKAQEKRYAMRNLVKELGKPLSADRYVYDHVAAQRGANSYPRRSATENCKPLIPTCADVATAVRSQSPSPDRPHTRNPQNYAPDF